MANTVGQLEIDHKLSGRERLNNIGDLEHVFVRTRINWNYDTAKATPHQF